MIKNILINLYCLDFFIVIIVIKKIAKSRQKLLHQPNKFLIFFYVNRSYLDTWKSFIEYNL